MSYKQAKNRKQLKELAQKKRLKGAFSISCFHNLQNQQLKNYQQFSPSPMGTQTSSAIAFFFKALASESGILFSSTA